MARVLELGTLEDDDAAGAAAATALQRGELVILPTDTLYALACRAHDELAIGRVRRAKGRDQQKPLPLVAADPGQLASLVDVAAAQRLVSSFWPGPLTLVLPAKAGVSDAITSGLGSVAVRVPAHAFLRRLCRQVGPLVSTSANRSGEPAPSSCAQAVSSMGEHVALAVDGGTGRTAPSTIVDMSGPEPRLVRTGVVPWADVLRVLRP